jgi:hypothetical protein
MGQMIDEFDWDRDDARWGKRLLMPGRHDAQSLYNIYQLRWPTGCNLQRPVLP